LQGRAVTVCENELGEIKVLLNSSPLAFQVFHQQPKQAAVVSSKDLNRKPAKPAADHPWRNYGFTLDNQPIQP